MVLTREGHEALCQSDEADTQCSLVDHTLDGIVGPKFVSTDPKTLHQQGELLCEGRLLELVTVVELLGSHLEHVVELRKEEVSPFLLDFFAQYFIVLSFTFHFLSAFQGEFYDVDGREREVTTSYRGLRSEAVLEHTSATTHRCHLV